MSESILERLRYYAHMVSVFPWEVIEAVDESLRGLSIGRILDMVKAAPYIEASPPPEMLSFNQKKGVCHEGKAKKRHNRMGSGGIK